MNNCYGICSSSQNEESHQQPPLQDHVTLIQIRVTEIEKSINILRDLNAEIRKCYEDYLLAVGQEKNTLHCDLTHKTDNLWTFIKKTHAEIVSLRDLKTVGETSLEIKVRRNMVSLCFRKFSNEVTTFQQFQVDYKAKQIDSVKRDLKIKFPSLNKEEVDNIIKDTFIM